MRSILLTFFIFINCFLIKAQEPVSIHLSEKDGLPDKEFYNIIEDSKGFIWLCADKGLFRYDGKSFKNYSNKEKRGLSVFNVFEDSEGQIWCNNISGQFFYVDNNKLHTFIDLNAVLKGELAQFYVKNNYLIVSTQNTIYFVNKTTKLIEKKYSNESANSNPTILNNNIFISTLNTVYFINKNNNYKKLFKIDIPNRDENNVQIITKKGTLFKLDSLLFLRQFRYQKNKFFKINIAEKKLEKLTDLTALEEEHIHDVFENNNQIWFSTTNGVFVYNWANNQFKLERKLLKGKNVTKTISDRDGNFWFITLNNGIYVMPNIFIEKFNISQDYQNIRSLNKINEHSLLFGSSNGNVGIYNIKNNTETTIIIPNKSRVSSIKYIPKNKISYIGKDNQSYILDHKTLEIKKSLNVSSAKSISLIKNNDVVIIDHKNTYLLKNDVHKKLEKLFTNRRPYTSYYHKKTNAIYIAYVDGLVKFDSVWNSKKITFKNKPIYGVSITETNDGILWVATFKDGIFGIKNNIVTHHVTTKNGLISNKIEKIKADKNNLWIATDAGIQLHATKTNTFKTLTKRDGIVSYDISGIEVLENKVIFSSSKGLFSVDKQKAFKPQKKVDAYFTSIEINEKEMPLTTDYELDYNQNSINFNFNVNGLIFNQKGNYKYRLFGYNNNWITTSVGETNVKYNSLPAGNYTFQVQPILDATNNKGKIIAIGLSIKKPFWKAWWFIFSIVILILSSTVLYYRNKIKKEEIQSKLEVKQLSLDNELIALKLENLRSQMNPHFIFNALNSIQEYIILNQKKLASEYLGKFADLIRTYLNHSTKGKITLQEEIDCLEMYLELEKLRFEDKLNYTISTAKNLHPEDVNIPTMLVQPYVENALKHGLLHRKTNRILKANFLINIQDKTIKCIIEDNGVGRNKANEFKERSGKKHASFASKATQDRLALLNYGKEKKVGVTITDLLENNKPSGTQVVIIIPFTTH